MKHSRLSPSSAHRWLQCPASIRMSDLLGKTEDDKESVFAAEGTAAHALAEIKARYAFDMINEEMYKAKLSAWRTSYRVEPETEAEMHEHTDDYVRLLKQRMIQFPLSNLMLEQRLSPGVPEADGTSDAVIVSPRHVESIDLKYGQGIFVEAAGNPQLRLYAIGALLQYGDVLGDIEIVRMTVHQPRLNHILTEELTPEELLAWRDEVVIPRAELALGDDAPFGPSESACRYCPASGRCAAQLEAVTLEDFGTPPELLSPLDISNILPRLPLIRQWLTAFEEAALETAYSQRKNIPGYKVVLSGGQRKVVDPEGAIARLQELGLTYDQITKTTVRGIGDLESLLGKPLFAEVMAPYIARTEGRPSLVTVNDRRDAISPESQAALDFADEPNLSEGGSSPILKEESLGSPGKEPK